MNFDATKKIISAMDKYMPKSEYIIETEGHKDYLGRKYIADYVEIINQPPYCISFEAVKNEIIVFYFGDHIHFEDYSVEPQENEPDYVARAIEFLEMLFTTPIQRKYTTKGDKVVRDESILILSEDEKESICVTYTSAGLKNLFKKRVETVKQYEFNAEKKSFREVKIP